MVWDQFETSASFTVQFQLKPVSGLTGLALLLLHICNDCYKLKTESYKGSYSSPLNLLWSHYLHNLSMRRDTVLITCGGDMTAPAEIFHTGFAATVADGSEASTRRTNPLFGVN